MHDALPRVVHAHAAAQSRPDTLKAMNRNRLQKYNKIFPNFNEIKIGGVMASSPNGVANMHHYMIDEGNPQSDS